MPNVGQLFIYDLALAFCFVSCFIALCALLYIRCALWRLLSCCFCLFFEGADKLGWGIIANLCASFVLLFKNVYALYSCTLHFYIGDLKVHYSISYRRTWPQSSNLLLALRHTMLIQRSALSVHQHEQYINIAWRNTWYS